MVHRVGFLVLAVAIAMAALGSDQRAADARMVEELKKTSVRIAGERAIVWAPAAWPAEERERVAAGLEAVVLHVEKILGRKFDARAYGQKQLEYFLSASPDAPSHVYGGYEHSAAAGDRPYIFLSGLESGEAPDIHETAHLIGGTFGSLLLREGVATYVQFAVRSGKMRPLVKLGDVTDVRSLDAALRHQLARPATRELTERWLASPAKKVTFASRPERGLFYAVSASWVAFLVERVGLEVVMEAYASEDPIVTLERRPGLSWKKLSAEWLNQVGTVSSDATYRAASSS